jgi:Na+-driven multidrug efflux pump
MLSGLVMCCAGIYNAMLISFNQMKSALFLSLSTFVTLIWITAYLTPVIHNGLDALVIANLISSIIVICGALFCLKKPHNISGNKISNHLIHYGSPVFLSYCLLFGSQFMMLSILSKFNTVVVASYSLMMRLQTFWLLPAFALGLSTAILFKRVDKTILTKQYLSTNIILNLVVYLLLYYFLSINNAPVIQFFSEDLAIIRVSAEYLHIVAFSLIGFAVAFSLFTYLENTGYAKHSLLIQFCVVSVELFLCAQIQNTSQDYIPLFKVIALFNWVMVVVVLIYLFITQNKKESAYENTHNQSFSIISR